MSVKAMNRFYIDAGNVLERQNENPHVSKPLAETWNAVLKEIKAANPSNTIVQAVPETHASETVHNLYMVSGILLAALSDSVRD